jgi:thiol-disulfide isomerase/thioredoxin
MAVLGLSIVLAGCDRQSGDQAQPKAQKAEGPAAPAPTGTIDRSHRGSAMPEFVLTDPKARELRLSSLKGKPLLINLWATWCAPCVVEMPQLDRLAADKGDALKVLTVSQDMGGADKVAAFFAQRKFARLEPWIDAKGDMPFHYNAATLPATIYYDAQGREVWRFMGGHDWTNAETQRMLAETVD